MRMQIIMIWGAAILVYLLIMHQSGTSGVLKSLQQFVSGTTSTLQGR